jgi:CIC family chloride channel protein
VVQVGSLALDAVAVRGFRSARGMRHMIGMSRKSWRPFHFTKRALLPIVFAESAPLDLRIVGRTLFHAALVGLSAGLVGSAFFAAAEHLQHFLLGDLAGYVPLRARGESVAAYAASTPFRPLVLALLPALGGLACGLLTWLAPETRGGGGDAMIDAFHHNAGVIRGRVIWLKALASLCTLSSGGAGGREGPTMQIGGALGSAVGRALHVSARERRILLVAGVAAGISAVFRTPLGAALLAVEVLYRDGFESDALIPAVLASVVSYSTSISIFGESTLFAHSARYPFIPAHLPLYGLLALLVAFLAAAFASMLRRSHEFFAKLAVPSFARPALGGLVLGLLATLLILLIGEHTGARGHGLGLLGGGYGAVQVAISGSPLVPSGWGSVELLFLVAIAKILAASLTIGSEGSAGDFAPALAIGGLVGGAFGRAAALLLADPRIDPGAFALVGMGAFYGGIAHVPLSALVLVCELAGTYDLLVPLMLALAIAFVALRNRSLYSAQPPTQHESPVHRDSPLRETLTGVCVRDVMHHRPHVSFQPDACSTEMLRVCAEVSRQDVFPVIDAEARMVGLIGTPALRLLATEAGDSRWIVAADIMQTPVCVKPGDDLGEATRQMLANGLREIAVVDEELRLIGVLDEAQIAAAYLTLLRDE